MKPHYEVCIEIGEIPIKVHTASAEFADMLRGRYGEFVAGWRAVEATTAEAQGRGQPHATQQEAESGSRPWCGGYRVPTPQFPVSDFELEVELLPPGLMSDAEEARVRLEGGRWVMERGDFRAECDPERRCGWVRQSANPYSIDAVLRMLHSLILARDGGFLVHAASAVRNGRAFLFAGVSGAGKTTISRLAPPDAVLLTDEISYVRKVVSHTTEVRKQLTPAYVAFGTPFAGELARIGQKLRAPIAALYFLGQGPENKIEDVSQADSVRALLQNILFFAHDGELTKLVFQTALEFVSCVPVRRLVFAPEAQVWELIR